MYITSHTITTYTAQCANCGAKGPERLSQQAAEQAALDDGWYEDSHFSGLNWYTITRCPTCYDEHLEGGQDPCLETVS